MSGGIWPSWAFLTGKSSKFHNCCDWSQRISMFSKKALCHRKKYPQTMFLFVTKTPKNFYCLINSSSMEIKAMLHWSCVLKIMLKKIKMTWNLTGVGGCTHSHLSLSSQNWFTVSKSNVFKRELNCEITIESCMLLKTQNFSWVLNIVNSSLPIKLRCSCIALWSSQVKSSQIYLIT